MVDRWRGRREASETTQGGHLTRIDRELTQIHAKGSERHSQIMGRILALELDVRELATVMRLRKHARGDS